MDIGKKKIKKCQISKVELTELKMVNKVKGPNEDASVSLGREKKPTTKGGASVLGGRENEGAERGI